MTGMNPAEEDHAITQVAQRLGQRYPQLSTTTVTRVISRHRANLSGPLRDFVPLLVERYAGEELRTVQTTR